MRRDGGYKDLANAIVQVTDSGVAENQGLSLLSFPFDADPEKGPDSQVSVQTVTPPGDGVVDARTLILRLYLTDVRDSGVSYWYDKGDPAEVTVPVADTGLAGGDPDAPFARRVGRLDAGADAGAVGPRHEVSAALRCDGALAERLEAPRRGDGDGAV